MGGIWQVVGGVGYVVGGHPCGIDGDMWQGWEHVVGCVGMWQGVGHVVGVVAGCGGMWQGSGHVAGGQAYGIDRDMW